MKRYSVGGKVTISVNCFVMADSVEEAKLKAQEADNASFCYQCSNGNQDPDEWHADELDGTVEIESAGEAGDE